MHKRLEEIVDGEEVTIMKLPEITDTVSRLSSLGVTKGTKIKIIRHQKNGPCIIAVRGSRLILGKDLKKDILVKKEIA